ncbi:MAG: aminodeoxychorismate lyase, partial [Gammaproteobacteria bacterium]|nr:aminodeoxychorismate lyase [Gammaproteobacteria bacterium]
RGTTDVKILKLTYDLMQRKLNHAWETRAPGLPYQTPEEALIVASMVEKEALFHRERPQIAGVILKRLAIGMRLQIDATVIYGRDQNYSNPLTRTDLRTDTAYNTYTRSGLPMAPICMPSISSIQAALHPQITDAIYYVAKGDGTHTFSKDLQGHNKAVGEYRAVTNANTKTMAYSNVRQQSTSPELMLKYWASLAFPSTQAVCLYVH